MGVNKLGAESIRLEKPGLDRLMRLIALIRLIGLITDFLIYAN